MGKRCNFIFSQYQRPRQCFRLNIIYNIILMCLIFLIYILYRRTAPLLLQPLTSPWSPQRRYNINTSFESAWRLKHRVPYCIQRVRVRIMYSAWDGGGWEALRYRFELFTAICDPYLSGAHKQRVCLQMTVRDSSVCRIQIFNFPAVGSI